MIINRSKLTNNFSIIVVIFPDICYRYQLLFLHGSTCLLAINAKFCPIGHTFWPFWVRDVEVPTYWVRTVVVLFYWSSAYFTVWIQATRFRVWDVHHPAMHEQRLGGEMNLPFMIGRNSCYFIVGWNFGILSVS